ncbi:IPT/TIG domain-containing protein [Spirosoma pomorum]
MRSIFPFLTAAFLLVGFVGCRVQTTPPELVSLTPGRAYVGQQVTLSGYQFGNEPAVLVGESTTAVSASVTSGDGSTIQIMVPHIAPGMRSVRVRTSEGTTDPLPLSVLQPAPVLTGVTPGNALAGTDIVLAGDYLSQFQRVRFDNTIAVIKDSSTAQRVTVTVPATLSRGPHVLVVETSGGQLTYPFIVAATPTITSISPKDIRPGGELIIQGTNLLDGIVAINGLTTDRNQSVITDTQIKAVVPTNATTGRVTVTVFERLIATSTDTLKVVQQPAITALNARDGIAGDKIILAGLNLRDITKVNFGDTPATFRLLSDTQIEATVPALTGSATVAVSAVSAGGIATAADRFLYYVAPSNITFTPARQLRGQPITISGQDVYRITDVKVAGESVPITTRYEGTGLLVNVPLNTGVSGPITVSNRAGSAVSARSLVVVQQPLVTSISPTKGKIGDRVVIKGNYLQDAKIYFTGSLAPAANDGKNEDTERWILVPSDAKTGPIRIVNSTDVAVNTDDFTVVKGVTITDFTPKLASIGGQIVMTGQNLDLVKEIRFTGSTTPARFVLEGTSLRITVPTGADIGPICVTSDAGTTCTTANFVLFRN